MSQNYGNGSGSFILVQPLENTAPSTLNISGTAPIAFLTSGQPVGGTSSGLITTTENSDIFLLTDPAYPLESLPMVEGSGGDILILDMDTLTIRNGGVLNARSRSAGQAGTIIVSGADTIDLINGGQIVTAGFRSGQAGTILLEATGNVTLNGMDPGYTQRAESIDVAYANFLQNLFTNFYDLDPQQAREQATGETATGEVIGIDRAFLARQYYIDPLSPASALQAQAGQQSRGSGTITVTSGGSLTLNQNAGINSDTFGPSNAGDVTLVIAGNIQLLNQSQIASQVSADLDRLTPVKGGNITVLGNSLTLEESTISSSTAGSGNAGDIRLTLAQDLTGNTQSSIRSLVEAGGIGDAGDVVVQANRLNLFNGAQIASGVFRGFVQPDGTIVPGGAGVKWTQVVRQF